MNKLKTIIFDYDGVIAESVDVKTDAFAQLYKPYGADIVSRVIEHHKANGGVSRFEKFKIYHGFLNEDITQSKIESLSNEFSNLVLQKVIDSPYVNGVYDFIISNYRKYNFYISTGTPTPEIETILKIKSIRKFFVDVYGSPDQKDLHVKKILETHGHNKCETVFIGDALTDRDAAKSNGINFIGRHTTEPAIKHEKFMIKDFMEIYDVIHKIQETI